MKKFNLQEALEGKRVVTRTGEEVSQLHLFHDLRASEQPLYGVIDGNIEYWNGTGTYIAFETPSARDLFMEGD